MKWREAASYMLDNCKIAHRSWPEGAYIYLENGVLLDQNGKPFICALDTRGKWLRVTITESDAISSFMADAI